MRAKLPWILLAISLALNVFVIGGYIYGKSRSDHRWSRWSFTAVAEQLDLNSAQKQALEKMRVEIRRSSDDSREQMRPLRRELLEELAKPQPDFAAADRRIDEIGDMQSKRYKAMVRAVHEFQQTLTPQQQEQFRKSMNEMMNRRGKRGDRDGERGEQQRR